MTSSVLTSACLLSTLLAAAPAPTTPPTSSLPDAAVLKALCPARKTCTVLHNRVAGTDAHGNDLVFAGVEELATGRAKNDDGESGEPCLPAPYAVLQVKAGRVVRSEPIVTLREGDCSYGVRGGGESITFDGTTATYTMDGGSNWAWSESKTWEITPRLRLISADSTGWWTVSSNYRNRSVDRRRGRTTVTWYVPDCGPDGELPEASQDDVRSGSAPKYGYLEIPRLGSAASLEWQSAAFPAAGLVITSQKNTGFITYGKPGTARDARFRVIALSSRELLVEVADAAISAEAKSWVHDDHLEIWAGPELPDYQTHCIQRDGKGKNTEAAQRSGVAQQWGIRTADGAVFRGMGKPQDDLKVERVELVSADWGRVVRFRIAFAKELASVSVAYSDSDHGKRQFRMLATSNIKLRDSLSLGTLAPVGDKNP